MNRLKGKRALITGGTSGIGLATAKQFLAEGARVAVTGLNADTLAQARRELGSEVVFAQIDAGNVQAQKQLAHILAETFGQVDVASSMPVSVFSSRWSSGMRPASTISSQSISKGRSSCFRLCCRC
jgi:enoyl-[acyl-carrier-protein] reductase (NADH)